MRVEAWVVALRNAAAPNSVGVVHPLLRRFQGGAASMIVFGLPAVLVRALMCSLQCCSLRGAHACMVARGVRCFPTTCCMPGSAASSRTQGNGQQPKGSSLEHISGLLLSMVLGLLGAIPLLWLGICPMLSGLSF